MTNELTTATAPKPPAPQTRAEADLLGVYRSRIVKTPSGAWSISDQLAPTGRDLELLRARRDHLRSFERADLKKIAARLARLFLRIPILANATAEQVTAYAMDLQAYPLWAIDAGIASILAGTALRSDVKAPTSLDICAAVRKAMEPVQDEIAVLNAVLNAEVWQDPGEAQRKRMVDGFAKLRDDLVKNNGFQPPYKAKDARDPIKTSEQPAIDYSAPLKLSAAARKTLPAHYQINDREAAE